MQGYTRLPLVVEYLKNKSFQQLEDDYGVCVRFSKDGTKASLNYDQILAKSGERLSDECRGMVIRPLQFEPKYHGDNWKNIIVGPCDVIAWPMNRFYNLGDPNAAKVNFDDNYYLRVYEKLDGTMIVLYWDTFKKKWCAATRSVPEADLPIFENHMEIGNMTFSELFFKALILTREELESKKMSWDPKDFGEIIHLNKEFTYVFELTSRFNRVVVKYDEPRATLLAARHLATGCEVQIESLNMQYVYRPKTWSLVGVDALTSFVDSANPIELEGVVVCDGHFNRQKIKNKAWILSSKAKDLVTVSRRSAMLAIIKGQIDDIVPLIDVNIANELLQMKERLRNYLIKIDHNFLEIKNSSTDRKSFATQVMASGDWSYPYFNMWENRSNSASECIEKLAEAGRMSDAMLDMLLKKVS